MSEVYQVRRGVRSQIWTTRTPKRNQLPRPPRSYRAEKALRPEHEMQTVGHTWGAALKRRGSAQQACTSSDNGSLHFFHINVWGNTTYTRRTRRRGGHDVVGSSISGMRDDGEVPRMRILYLHDGAHGASLVMATRQVVA